jgi:hypothetical protein
VNADRAGAPVQTKRARWTLRQYWQAMLGEDTRFDKRAIAVLLPALVLFVATIAWESAVGAALGAAAWLLVTLTFVFNVRARRKASLSAINVPIGLFVAFSRASCACLDIKRPLWLTVFALTILGTLLAGGIPFAVFVVSREQDERERRIILTAISFAFLAVTMVVVAFVLLEQYMNVDVPSISWVLLAGAATWLGSYFVLRERM